MAMRLIALSVLTSALAGLAPLQGVGAWQLMYSTPDELLVAIATAEFRGSDRPTIFIHCKDGAARVFFKPASPVLRFNFDDEGIFRGRFVVQSFGFESDAQGRLVERTTDTGVPPLRGLENADQLIESMQEHERLYVRVGRGSERNHFELEGFDQIMRERGAPCLPIGGS